MKKGIAKFTAYCMAVGMTFGGNSIVAFAAGADLPLVGVGSTSRVSQGTAASAASFTETSEDVTKDSTESAGEESDLAGIAGESVSTEDAADKTANSESDSTADTSTEGTSAGQESESADKDASAAEVSTTEANTTEGSASEASSKEAAVEEPAPLDTSMVDTVGISQCEEYINIRSSADTDGEVLGKLYNNSAVYIEDVDENGWYKVRSGNVEGYVSGLYIAVGEEAESLSNQVGYNVAEIGAEVLNVRASASQDSEIVTTVTNSQEIEVIEECGEWLKVAVDTDCYGYVSVDYVNTETQYKVAESIEEEQARLDAEYEAYLAEQAAAEAAYAAYVASQSSYSEPSYSEPSYNVSYEPSYDSYAQQEAQAAWEEAASAQAYAEEATQATVDAQAQADALYQSYLDAQAEADAATQTADEQAVIDTAAEAEAQYLLYLQAQEEADAQAQAEADAAWLAQQANETAQQAQADAEAAEYVEEYYEEEYAEGTYTDDTYYTDYTEEYYEEEYYEEEYVEEPSYSSVGQQIADFACQFVGNPYVWGGSSLTGGADCSGFTMSVMAHFGISLPHNAAAQSGYGTPVSLDSLQPGDLLFYNGDGGIGHVTIYIGNGQVVHASNSNTGITISSYSYRTPCAARRFV